MKVKGKWVWIVFFILIILCLLFVVGFGMFIYDYVSVLKVIVKEMLKLK